MNLKTNNGSHLFVLGASIGYSLVNPLVDSSQDPSGWVACTSKTKNKIWYAIFDRAYKGNPIQTGNYKNKKTKTILKKMSSRCIFRKEERACSLVNSRNALENTRNDRKTADSGCFVCIFNYNIHFLGLKEGKYPKINAKTGHFQRILAVKLDF